MMDIYRLLHIAFLAGFLVLEAVIAGMRNKRFKVPSARRERVGNTLFLLVTGTSLCLATGTALLAGCLEVGWLYNPDGFAAVVGITVIACGLGIRLKALQTLRRFLAFGPANRGGCDLLQTGLYKLVRHPSYFGMLLSGLGFGVFTANWLAALIILAPHAVVIGLRIRDEDGAMAAYCGPSYEKYRKSTPWLIPSIL